MSGRQQNGGQKPIRSAAIERLRELDREIQLLRHSAALLNWDQETKMPKGGIVERSEQLALLEGLSHERLASVELGDLLDAAGSTEDRPAGAEDLPPRHADFLRVLRREYERATKIPTRLVREMASAVSTAQAVWVDARGSDDFPSFAPHLEKLLKLNVEKAEAIGYEKQIYDALLDEYEPSMTTERVGAVFDELKKALVPFVQELVDRGEVEDSFLHQTFPQAGQEAFCRRVLSDIGYDFSRGRLDVSAHPFTISVGGDDIRITTHYRENKLTSALFGSIHEGGHALYEMGIAEEHHGSLLGKGTSLGIHESQSRTWENMIGRSISFWHRYFPVLKEYFPGLLDEVGLGAWIRAVNRVQPSLIRIEADELTYSLHVILRFELELALVNGEIPVSDLPGRWNEAMQRLLGVQPKNDTEGVLQDIHWAMGAIGYFPTYALGNLYGAQFYRKMEKDLGDVDPRILNGDFESLRKWMEENIHRHGSSRLPAELLEELTGEVLHAEPYISYLREKYGKIYEL
jgi:carboxypeptidase Taq